MKQRKAMNRGAGFQRTAKSFENSKYRNSLVGRPPPEIEAVCGAPADSDAFAHQPLAATKPLSRGTYASSPAAAPIEKMEVCRSESYRRLIAALPCSYCRIEGYSQAAHPPPKGKGIKESDLECFPLCCVRVGEIGCHQRYDQYLLLPKPAMRLTAAYWAKAAREALVREGLWK